MDHDLAKWAKVPLFSFKLYGKVENKAAKGSDFDSDFALGNSKSDLESSCL